MSRRAAGFAFFLSLLIAASSSGAAAQNGKQQRIAEVAYETEMAHQAGACPEAQTVADRDVCLNDARVETYQNYKTFFDALREALIESSADDANALALDRTDLVFEKYRVTACDAMAKTYDTGTVKHPGSSEPSAQTRCLILLTRSRMRDLKELYAATL
ncbi:MAG: lysozyme inhibitor LprI family protein [Acidobacteriaceae bacterium]